MSYSFPPDSPTLVPLPLPSFSPNASVLSLYTHVSRLLIPPTKSSKRSLLTYSFQQFLFHPPILSYILPAYPFHPHILASNMCVYTFSTHPFVSAILTNYPFHPPAPSLYLSPLRLPTFSFPPSSHAHCPRNL